jgi:hypothetical protein
VLAGVIAIAMCNIRQHHNSSIRFEESYDTESRSLHGVLSTCIILQKCCHSSTCLTTICTALGRTATAVVLLCLLLPTAGSFCFKL